MEAPCCPPDSIGATLPPADYKPFGKMIKLGEIEAYEVGSREAGKAILVFPDIWGWDSGRTRGVCDALARETGAYVLAPGAVRRWWFLNEGPSGWRLPVFLGWVWWYAGYSAMTPYFTSCVEPHLASLGIQKYAISGFCLGAFNAVCAGSVAVNKPSAAVLFHPSFQVFGKLGNPTVEEVLSKVKAPTLMMPGSNDPELVLEGGDAQKIIKASGVDCRVIRVNQPHGFCNRGDTTKEDVKKDVEAALAATVEFLKDKL